MGNSSVVSIRVETLGFSIAIVDGNIAIEQTKPEIPADKAMMKGVDDRARALDRRSAPDSHEAREGLVSSGSAVTGLPRDFGTAVPATVRDSGARDSAPVIEGSHP
jgi:hypothetical protein